MNGPEIFSLVQAKRQRIEKLFDPTTFVLNKEVQKLQEEICALQEECQHEFDITHVCKYCGKEEQ
jgi:hypothetical protein